MVREDSVHGGQQRTMNQACLSGDSKPMLKNTTREFGHLCQGSFLASLLLGSGPWDRSIVISRLEIHAARRSENLEIPASFGSIPHSHDRRRSTTRRCPFSHRIRFREVSHGGSPARSSAPRRALEHNELAHQGPWSSVFFATVREVKNDLFKTGTVPPQRLRKKGTSASGSTINL